MDPRQPLSPAILVGLSDKWGAVCNSEYEAALFHAAALIAFFGALRVSELVASSKRDTSDRALHLDDVILGTNTILIKIRRSKTDQAGQGKQVQLHGCDDPKLCPIKALASFLEVRGQEAGFLFIHSDGSPLTKYQFWVVTSKALASLGLQGVQFGTHSFRIGAASTAAAMGYSSTQIQGLGRWRSRAFQAYVRPLRR